MLELIWLIPLLPVLGVVVNGFFGNRMSRRAVGLVAWVATQGPATPDEAPVTAGRTAVVAPAPVAPQSAVLEIEQPLPERRPSKCGDLPRAPWNTCVALHDHEI